MLGAGREAGKGGCVMEQTMSTCTSADRDGSSLLVQYLVARQSKEGRKVLYREEGGRGGYIKREINEGGDVHPTG
jgi:hypothetical protein